MLDVGLERLGGIAHPVIPIRNLPRLRLTARRQHTDHSVFGAVSGLDCVATITAGEPPVSIIL